MSRVDEALRRAAEANAGTAAGKGTDPTQEPLTAGFDAEQPSQESFPIEMPEGRPNRQAQLSVSPVTTPSARRPIEAAEEPAASTEPLVLTRFDARMACKVVVDQAMNPVSREQYRRLAATLHHRQETGRFNVVMIASAAVGEGKTLTASNLALTLSESYKRSVLLIDADLRRPSLHAVFKTTGTPGLSEGLAVGADQKVALQVISQHLTLLPAGAPSSDPMAALISTRMRQLIDEARQAFDWVIIDTPPVGLLTDASLLAAMVDGVILVVSAGSTHYDLVRRAVDLIGQNRLVGVVLNRAASYGQRYGYGYGYGYGYDHYRHQANGAPASQ